MTQVSKGVTLSEIARILTDLGHNIHRRTIGYIRRRYELKWNIRHWTSKQVNLKAPIK